VLLSASGGIAVSSGTRWPDTLGNPFRWSGSETVHAYVDSGAQAIRIYPQRGTDKAEITITLELFQQKRPFWAHCPAVGRISEAGTGTQCNSGDRYMLELIVPKWAWAARVQARAVGVAGREKIQNSPGFFRFETMICFWSECFSPPGLVAGRLWVAHRVSLSRRFGPCLPGFFGRSGIQIAL
jgi:hypothetical protein